MLPFIEDVTVLNLGISRCGLTNATVAFHKFVQ